MTVLAEKLSPSAEPRVGVVLVGHGTTATAILHAAKAIAPPESLEDVVAIDAGEGETEGLGDRICETLRRADVGRGVLMIVDVMGSSPCLCGRREAGERDVVIVSGLCLGLLLRLAMADRRQDRPGGLRDLAETCAESTRRGVSVDIRCMSSDEAGAESGVGGPA